MLRFLTICLGGALGTGARYGVGLWAARTLGAGFPFGTLLVNVVGSFLISVVMYLSADVGVISPGLRLFLTTGFMGGFTTYSSFNYETLKLIQGGAWATAAANVVLTLCAAAIAGVFGLWAGARLAAGLR